MSKIAEAIKSGLTPPMIVALAALMVALSGSAYAGINLSKNSVGTPQIKNGAVKTSKLGSDVRRKLNEVGPQGPQGERGPQGIPGQNGQDGLRGIQGPAGMVNWNNVYEVVATRTGTECPARAP